MRFTITLYGRGGELDRQTGQISDETELSHKVAEFATMHVLSDGDRIEIALEDEEATR